MVAAKTYLLRAAVSTEIELVALLTAVQETSVSFAVCGAQFANSITVTTAVLAGRRTCFSELH